jgi:hypothetical protein
MLIVGVTRYGVTEHHKKNNSRIMYHLSAGKPMHLESKPLIK